MNAVMTLNELDAKYGIPASTLHGWCERGYIRATKLHIDQSPHDHLNSGQGNMTQFIEGREVVVARVACLLRRDLKMNVSHENMYSMAQAIRVLWNGEDRFMSTINGVTTFTDDAEAAYGQLTDAGVGAGYIVDMDRVS